MVSAPVSRVGIPTDFVDTGQIPEESVVRIHERVCMYKLVGARLEMAGAAGILRIVLDSYSAGMTMGGSVAADFLWMTMVICCFLATRLGEEDCQHASRMCPAELVFVSGLHRSSKGGPAHDQPERMPAMDGAMYREGGVPDSGGAAAA